MTGFLIIIHTIVSILLISVVLMQASQGGGLSGTFGGQAASSVLGGQNAGNVFKPNHNLARNFISFTGCYNQYVEWTVNKRVLIINCETSG